MSISFYFSISVMYTLPPFRKYIVKQDYEMSPISPVITG